MREILPIGTVADLLVAADLLRGRNNKVADRLSNHARQAFTTQQLSASVGEAVELLKKARHHLPFAAQCWNEDEDRERADRNVKHILGLIDSIEAFLSDRPTAKPQGDPVKSPAVDELVEALERISNLTMSQFELPHDMAEECVNIASLALAKVKGE